MNLTGITTGERRAQTEHDANAKLMMRGIRTIQIMKVKTRMDEKDKEIGYLRDVYEAARRVLRYNGIDSNRTEGAVEELKEAIEWVKRFDGGTLDD